MGTSQRQASAVMAARDFPVKLQTLQAWEQGRYTPGRLAVHGLERFLVGCPVITDAPIYDGKRVSKFSAKEVAEIRRLQAEGQTQASIAARFKVHESYREQDCEEGTIGGLGPE